MEQLFFSVFFSKKLDKRRLFCYNIHSTFANISYRQEFDMRYSKQRELIFNTVLQNKIHPTADFVYNKLKLDHPELSLGTVYRNLNFLAEHNMLLKISVPNGSDRFDGSAFPHHHLICKKCGKVFDIDVPELNGLYERAENNNGFIIDRCSLAFEGVCINCSDEIIKNNDTSNT